MDYKEVGRLAQYRDEWKTRRARHIENFEKMTAKNYQGDSIERNTLVAATDLICFYCDQECKIKAGLITHIKRMQEQSSQRVIF